MLNQDCFAFETQGQGLETPEESNVGLARLALEFRRSGTVFRGGY